MLDAILRRAETFADGRSRHAARPGELIRRRSSSAWPRFHHFAAACLLFAFIFATFIGRRIMTD